MTELNERIGNDNWCVDAHGNVTRNGARLCGPDGLDAYAPIVRRLLAAWWAAQPPCADPVVGEWHGHLVSRCHRCVHYYPRNCGWTCELEKEPATCGSRVEEPVVGCHDQFHAPLYTQPCAEFVPPPGEFSGCRCLDCSEKQSPKRLCRCCQERRDEERCGELPDPLDDDSDPPKPLTWPEAERIMLAGGECEHWFPDTRRWTKSRIYLGKRQYANGDGHWCDDPTRWSEYKWRLCPSQSRHTWEQAEAGMRRGEVWVGNRGKETTDET